MKALGPRSIRGKTACVATAVTAVAMALTVAVVAFATQSVVVGSLSDSLEGRIDEVAERIEEGSVPAAIATTGSTLVQVIDAEGNVVGASDWAQGVSAISDGGLAAGEQSSRETDDFELVKKETPQNVTALEVVVDDRDDTSDDAAVEQPVQPEQPAQPAQPEQPAQPSSPAPTYSDGDSGYGDSGYSEYESSYEGISLPGRVSWLDWLSGLVPRDAAAIFAPRQAWASEQQQDAEAPSDIANLPASQSAIRATDLFGEEGPFLVVERGVASPDGPLTVAAMTSLAPAVSAAKTTAMLLGIVFAIGLVLVAALSWLLAARTLRPVESMRSAAEAISMSDLSGRIPVPEQDIDLSKLAGTFNAMLARIEASVSEQRRFVSDASHELKSPVAAIRIMLETMRDHPDAVNADELLGDLMGENERVSGIVSDLLLLARHDEGTPRLAKEPLDMCDVLYEEAALLKGRTAHAVDVSDVQPVVCIADHESVSHAVRNLLDNASRYAESRVKISCAQESGIVRIVVSDDGKGIPPADRERVFGRFVRLEEGRSRKEGSTGLGLAVVKTVAEQHGGTVEFTDPEIGGATAVLTIPSE